MGVVLGLSEEGRHLGLKESSLEVTWEGRQVELGVAFAVGAVGLCG